MTTIAQQASLRALLGRTCIYREKWLICVVQVTDVAVDERGVRFVFKPVPTPGFDRRRVAPEPMRAGAAWQTLHQTPFSLSATYVSWFLAIAPEIVAQLLAFATTAPSDEDVMDEMHRLVAGAEHAAPADESVN